MADGSWNPFDSIASLLDGASVGDGAGSGDGLPDYGFASPSIALTIAVYV